MTGALADRAPRHNIHCPSSDPDQCHRSLQTIVDVITIHIATGLHSLPLTSACVCPNGYRLKTDDCEMSNPLIENRLTIPHRLMSRSRSCRVSHVVGKLGFSFQSRKWYALEIKVRGGTEGWEGEVVGWGGGGRYCLRSDRKHSLNGGPITSCPSRRYHVNNLRHPLLPPPGLTPTPHQPKRD